MKKVLVVAGILGAVGALVAVSRRAMQRADVTLADLGQGLAYRAETLSAKVRRGGDGQED